MDTSDSDTVSRGADTVRPIRYHVDGETVAHLISQASAAGFPVTKRQIERWNYNRLLPDPVQIPTDRPGSITIYPAGTAIQLLSLCQIKKNCRKLEDVGWHLWMKRFPIEESVWRPTLEKAVDWWDINTKYLKELFYPHDQEGISGTALNFVDEFKDARSRDILFRNIRRAISSKNIPSVIRIAFELLFGRFSSDDYERLEPDETTDSPRGDKRIFAGALGFKRAWADHLRGDPPLLSESIATALVTLSNTLLENHDKSIKYATTLEIIQTRNEWNSVLSVLSRTGFLLEQAYGKHAFGLGIIQYFAADNRPKQQAIMLALWFKIRHNDEYKNGAANIISLEEAVNSLYFKFCGLQDKSRNVPALRELFFPKRLKQALRNPEAGKVFSLELSRLLQSLQGMEMLPE
jgi:hypothetical protein